MTKGVGGATFVGMYGCDIGTIVCVCCSGDIDRGCCCCCCCCDENCTTGECVGDCTVVLSAVVAGVGGGSVVTGSRLSLVGFAVSTSVLYNAFRARSSLPVFATVVVVEEEAAASRRCFSSSSRLLSSIACCNCSSSSFCCRCCCCCCCCCGTNDGGGMV